MAKRERYRINMRLPSDLVRWAKREAKTHGKSFTSVVEEALLEARNGDALSDATAKRVVQSRRLHAADV
jgi:hypothetical protein